MNTRLSQFIDYATGGNKADFARSLGWSPQYLPVMTAEEQQRIIAGDFAFDADTYAKWQMLLAEKKASIDGRIQAALDRQKARQNE